MTNKQIIVIGFGVTERIVVTMMEFFSITDVSGKRATMSTVTIRMSADISKG